MTNKITEADADLISYALSALYNSDSWGEFTEDQMWDLRAKIFDIVYE